MITGKVFVDSSFWIALRDWREPWHEKARQSTRQLLAERTQLVFTSLVFAEVHAHFTRSTKIRLQVMNDAQQNRAMKWEAISPLDEAEALELLRQHNDKQYSFCDAVSCVVMRRLGLQRAASFDKHFHQFGEFEIIC
ncbi:MAG: type II toxin-antitoxin system VapC family toxin [Limisphaerales bacterium]